MSKLTYLHKVINESIKNGEKITYEELIIEGPKGITVKMFSKDKNGAERISISGNDNKFVMRTMVGDKKDETHLTKDELVAELKKNKKLKFAAEFVKTQKGGAWLMRTVSKRVGSKKVGSKKVGSKRVGSKKVGSKKVGSKKVGSKK